jgi:hypothetical protein
MSPRFELLFEPDRFDIGVLHQIFGVGRVARQTHGGPVQTIDMVESLVRHGAEIRHGPIRRVAG